MNLVRFEAIFFLINTAKLQLKSGRYIWCKGEKVAACAGQVMVIATAVGTSAYLEWFLSVPNISTDSGFT